jgi:hypothetical protein
MFNIPSDKELGRIPVLYSTEGVKAGEKLIYMHFFLGSSDWFVVEFDGDDRFFGFVCLNGWREFAEWGYFSFKELKELQMKQPIVVDGRRDVLFLEVECDEYWLVRKARDVKLICECQGW